MTTVATMKRSVGQVFRQHSWSIALGAPLMQVQELALAINLEGRHNVVLTYEITDAAPGGHALVVGTKPAGAEWTDRSGLRVMIYLPSRRSTEKDRQGTINELHSLAFELAELLEGEPV